MASNWFGVDNNFPTFTGKEKPAEQISALVNYMFILTEQLKYILSNLDATNWSSVALKNFSEETTKDLDELVALLGKQVSSLSSSAESMASRVSGVEKKQNETDENVEAIEKEHSHFAAQVIEETGKLAQGMRSLEEVASELEKMILDNTQKTNANEHRIEETEADVDELMAGVKKTEDGYQIGEQGGVLNLVGKVYINGVLIE